MSGNGRPGGPGGYRRMDEFNRRIKEAQRREASAKARQARRDANKSPGGCGPLLLALLAKAGLAVLLVVAALFLAACDPTPATPGGPPAPNPTTTQIVEEAWEQAEQEPLGEAPQDCPHEWQTSC